MVRVKIKMYILDKLNNETIALEKKTFQELGFKERYNLQEWIYKNPNMLEERLLIIQKEFDGFDDTNERLDLLALDENGNIVVIENKLDDSGKDVTWQSLKYVSYCSSLTKENIREIYQKHLNSINSKEMAEEKICEFLEKDDFNDVELNTGDQRIILVAGRFRKEVTSTVMWLRDHGVKIKCIKVSPYILNEQVFIDTEQIIPIRDAEDYIIKIANKKQEELELKETHAERHKVRLKFWRRLLDKMNSRSDLYKNVNPTKDNWLNCGSGYSDIKYEFIITGKNARIGLYIDKGNQNINNEIFDNLYSMKDEIENKFQHELMWLRLDDKKACKISYSLENVNVFSEEYWDKMVDFMVENMINFNMAIKEGLDMVMKNKKIV